MSPKIKMGRPVLPKKALRQVFSTRFTTEQIAAFEKAAKRDGLTLREWVEKYLVEAAE